MKPSINTLMLLVTVSSNSFLFSAPKDFAREVIQAVFTPPESKKMSRAEQIKIEAQNRSLSRAIKASNKSKI